MNCKFVALAAGLVAGIASVGCVSAHEIYGTVGTEGVGVGYGFGLNPYVGARADVNGFALSRSFDAGQLHYDGKARFVHGGVYADVFPFPSTVTFRLSVGAIVGDDRVNLVGRPQGTTYTFNGTTYNVAGQTVNGRIKMPAVRPYIGIGFGHAPKGEPGWSMAFDAGVTYGRPKVELDVPNAVVSVVGQALVDEQRQALQDKADKLKFYPIVKVGVTYRW